MITPQLAPVRPRGQTDETAEILPLDEIVPDLLRKSNHRIVQICGGPGTGKSTALAHLAAAMGAGPEVQFLDEPTVEEVASLSAVRRVVFSHGQPAKFADCRVTLAPWTDDDLMEYVLAVRPQRCAMALSCVRTDPDHDALSGSPALWRVTLDALLADQPAASLRDALVRALNNAFPSAELRRVAAEFCVARLLNKPEDAFRLLAIFSREDPDLRWVSWLRYAFIQQILAGERLEEGLLSEEDCAAFDEPLPSPLIAELARRATVEPKLGLRLQAIFDGDRRVAKPQAATVLHAADPKWRPADDQQTYLVAGSFPQATWSGLRLSVTPHGPSDLSRANLHRADLRGSNLDGMRLQSANLSGARLDKASLIGLDAAGADFSDAKLIAVAADCGNFRKACLRCVLLDDAWLVGATLDEADLRGASFRNADLSNASLLHCQIDGTDFRDAVLNRCNLSHLVLREAEINGARFQCANLSNCDLEGAALSSADFFKANLHESRLTGSRMPRADFREANLRGAGLADIDWEMADLRGADLRGCSFHMGSSRSGLVGSPYPGHGSKTGFYTDDYYDQTHKAPEEIRKANLCRADLRGAKLDGVDFYLVDLRGAKFDVAAAEHLSRSGAILVERFQ